MKLRNFDKNHRNTLIFWLLTRIEIIQKYEGMDDFDVVIFQPKGIPNRFYVTFLCQFLDGMNF